MDLIGSRIKNIRKTKKISQKKLAETIGCATVSIQKYESNERTPSLEVLSNIAAALGVLVSELIDYEVPKDMDIKTGGRIKEIRKSKKITQKEMSNILNINIRTYQKYESDEIALNLEILKKIAVALDVTVSEILGESLSSKNLTLENFTTEELLEEIKRRAIKYGL